MLARNALRRAYFKSNRHLHRLNPARRWVPHWAAFTFFSTAIGIVSASYVRAKMAPHGEARFAGTVIETLMLWLPASLMSQLWGETVVSDILPRDMHKAIIWWYGGTSEDTAEFQHAQEFFTRTFKPGTRPVDEAAPYVSPCDGTVLAVVDMTNEDRPQVVQVKDHFYAIENVFRGRFDLVPKDHGRYTMIIQLDRSDVHRVHSPADFAVNYSTHIPGTLLPTSVGASKWLPQLYLTNERVALVGKPAWAKPDANGRESAMGMALVGGLCKGSVRLDFDERVVTNTEMHVKAAIQRRYSDCTLAKGDALGHFELGSAVVLMIDTPTPITIKPGERVKMGQPIVEPLRRGMRLW